MNSATTCVNGHSKTPENSHVRVSGSTYCKTCMRNGVRKRFANGRQRKTCKRGHPPTPENTYIYKQKEACRECVKIRSLEWRRKVGPDYNKKRWAQNLEHNRRLARDNQRRWRSKPENRIKANERTREWHSKNTEKKREYARRWRAANVERRKATFRSYSKRNRDRIYTRQNQAVANLKDSYIRALLKINTPILRGFKDFPPQLMEAKRRSILLRRKVNQHKKIVNK